MRYNDVRQIYNRIKQSAKKRNIDFELTIVDLNNLSIPLTCPILGIPLAQNYGQAQDNSYSIDRIDSTKGYSADNIIVISWLANRLKSNGTTEQIRLISEFYQNLERENISI